MILSIIALNVSPIKLLSWSDNPNIENEKKAILSLLKKTLSIKISDFAEIIYQRFSPYISDTHFSIESSNKNCPAEYRFITGYRLYFSDLYVIKGSMPVNGNEEQTA